jgi:processive 1,2-diacylglycerol beta-glucosyltransferase
MPKIITRRVACPVSADVLILFASFGGGHAQAATNLASSIRYIRPAADVRTLDVLECLPTAAREAAVLAWRTASQRLAPLYDTVYVRSADRWRSSHLIQKIIYAAFAGIERSVAFNSAQVVIATHWLGAAVASIAKGRHNFLLAVAATDYLLHSLHVWPEVDIYFVPKQFAPLMNGRDLAFVETRAFRVGIPIHPAFAQFTAHRTQRHVIVSFGASGLLRGETLRIISRVARRLPELQFSVMAGRNANFRKGAVQLFGEHAVFSPTDQNVVPLYESATAFLGKAGGLSVSEAIASRLHVGLIHALPGQETINARITSAVGDTVRIRNESELERWLSAISTGDIGGAPGFLASCDSSVRIAAEVREAITAA